MSGRVSFCSVMQSNQPRGSLIMGLQEEALKWDTSLSAWFSTFKNTYCANIEAAERE